MSKVSRSLQKALKTPSGLALITVTAQRSQSPGALGPVAALLHLNANLLPPTPVRHHSLKQQAAGDGSRTSARTESVCPIGNKNSP